MTQILLYRGLNEVRVFQLIRSTSMPMKRLGPLFRHRRQVARTSERLTTRGPNYTLYSPYNHHKGS